MAVKELDHKIRRYIGDTTDTKPTAASHNATPGSTYYDRQTGIMYITYDGTNWVEKGTIISGKCKTVSVTKACAAAGDYAAEDVISESATEGTAWTFAAIFRANNTGGYITKALVSCETTGLTHQVSLYLFNAAPTSNLDDNVANTAVLNADIGKYVGVINFPALSDKGGNSEAIVTSSSAGVLPLWVDAATAADDLLGILITEDAITGETATDDYTIKLTLEQY